MGFFGRKKITDTNEKYDEEFGELIERLELGEPLEDEAKKALEGKDRGIIKAIDISEQLLVFGSGYGDNKDKLLRYLLPAMEGVLEDNEKLDEEFIEYFWVRYSDIGLGFLSITVDINFINLKYSESYFKKKRGAHGIYKLEVLESRESAYYEFLSEIEVEFDDIFNDYFSFFLKNIGKKKEINKNSINHVLIGLDEDRHFSTQSKNDFKRLRKILYWTLVAFWPKVDVLKDYQSTFYK